MTCPVCAGGTTVNLTRAFCDSIVRRRKCKLCGYTFYTEEIETPEAEAEANRWLRENRRKAKEVEK